MKRLFVFAILAVWAGSTVQASLVPLNMELYADYNDTRIFRGELSVDVGATLEDILLTDILSDGGESGVFSGIDIDVVGWSWDANPVSAEGAILPLETADTYVARGSFRTPTSLYPTANHPGEFFGLNTDGSIDFATATLSELDAYDPYWLMGDARVDSTLGSVSVGDGGSMTVRFPTINLTSNDTIYLFVGEVGHNECLRVSADLNYVPEPATIGLLGISMALMVGSKSRLRQY